MTPWDISIGTSGNEDNFHGMAQSPTGTNLLAVTPFYMRGINTANGNFAFRSTRIPLVTPNNAWIANTSGTSSIPSVSQSTNVPKDNNGMKFIGSTNFISVPIVFNSQNSTQVAGKTAALSFIVTSSTGFDYATTKGANQNVPSPTLSYGDGTNSYGWQSSDMINTVNYSDFGKQIPTATNFLTLQALQGGTSWVPITPSLTKVVTNNGIPSPVNLNTSGLAYQNFSGVAGDGGKFDLVVILQSGDYADCSLIFVAVPTANNSFLSGASAVRK
jgi:hypothetical protein